MLITYANVFSRTSSDVGRTDLVEHSIPLLPNTVPIHHAPRRLGREREAEVERQVDDLLAKNLIVPAVRVPLCWLRRRTVVGASVWITVD